jgi:hypothetical protein
MLAAVGSEMLAADARIATGDERVLATLGPDRAPSTSDA